MQNKLLSLLENAIGPKGQSATASIVLMKDGNYFFGVSIKNDIYRDYISSEAGAISAAITRGYKKGDFARIYIMTSTDKISDLKYYNREMIAEFFEADTSVCLLDKNSNEKIILVADLYREVIWKQDL